jgi:peptidoglycan/LPS O-acetylase OafA/YrhL
MDHFRAIAVLWVLLFHGFYAAYDADVHWAVAPFRAIAAPGWMGVHLFFVVSGYCITASARRIHDTRRYVVHFARDRFYRIFPVYWAALATTLVADALLWPVTHAPLERSLPRGIIGWIGNLFLIQPYVNTGYSNIVYWSLVVELGFYGVVALLLVIARATSWRTALMVGLGVGAAAVALPPDLRLRIEFLGYFPEFVCGATVFVAVEAWLEQKRATVASAVVIILAFGIAGHVLPHPKDAVLAFSAVCALVLLAAAPFDKAIVMFKPTRFMAWIGTLSYSLYLTHLTFSGRVMSLASRKIAPTNAVYLLVEVIAVGIGIAAAQLFYNRIELPLNRWRKAQGKTVGAREMLSHSDGQNEKP